jgi:two-component system, OmpR family, response regulator ResD
MTCALIVDGSPNLRLLYSLFLSHMGVDVHNCPDFTAALAQLAEDSSIEVVFLNLSYPFKDGLDCIWQIRSRYPQTAVVVICNAKDGVEAEALSRGAASFLYAPVRKSDFEKVLQQLQMS